MVFAREIFGSLDCLLSLPVAVPYDPAPTLWAQLLTALVIGLLTTFAFQFLLTNLGVALGISIWSLRPAPEVSEASSSAALENSLDSGKPLLPLDNVVGLGILGTVNLGLFAACFLAAKFSQINGPAEGAIAGITIWSAYLLLLLWVSAQTVNSVASFLLDRATGGLRRLVGAMAQVFQSSEDSITEEQLADSVRQEVQAVLQSTELRTLLETQLQTLAQSYLSAGPSPPENEREPASAAPSFLWQTISSHLEQADSKSLSPKRLDRKLQKILQAALVSEPNGLFLPSFEAAPLVQLLEHRQDLSPKRKQRILEQVEETWQHFRAEQIGRGVQANVSPADNAEEKSFSLPTELLHSALEAALKQVGERLPGLLLQPSKSAGLGLASMVLSSALSNLQSSVETLETPSVDVSNLKHQLDALIEESPVDLAHLGRAALTQAESLRDWALQPLDSVQDAIAHRVNTLQNQARRQAERTRRNAAKAAWWLFATAFTGAGSAAIAGALATGLKLPHGMS